VSWPGNLSRHSAALPTPFVIFFHASMWQNREHYYQGPYPYDFDYVFYGLWNYLNYRESPLRTWPFSLGLPYQVAVSGKPVALVLPCSSVNDEIGSFRSSADMATTLRDLEGCLFRRAGVYDPPPGIGRLALAAFSGSNSLLADFLNTPANRAHELWQNNLREIYSFDAVDGDIAGTVSAILSWAAAIGGVDMMARIYRQGDAGVLSQFLPSNARPSGPPVVATTPDGRWTLGIIPDTAWKAATAARGAALSKG
jgi:hypothetical protein